MFIVRAEGGIEPLSIFHLLRIWSPHSTPVKVIHAVEIVACVFCYDHFIKRWCLLISWDLATNIVDNNAFNLIVKKSHGKWFQSCVCILRTNLYFVNNISWKNLMWKQKHLLFIYFVYLCSHTWLKDVLITEIDVLGRCNIWLHRNCFIMNEFNLKEFAFFCCLFF